MLKAILIGLVVLIAAVLIFAATKPDSFRVERTTRIKAQPEQIAPLITDFHAWNAWSPYEKLDPAMQRTYGGAASGEGAVYQWSGNAKAGEGRMEIAEVSSEKITIALDFTKPMKTHNIAAFVLAPQGDATQVTWSMDGASPFLSKVMSVFINMDRMIGKDFETGLANLKAVAEK